MAKNPKEGKLLYHLTALENLKSIIEKGLLPRVRINFDFKNIADEEILGDREKFDLKDFTPFHFFSPTPFSGAAQIANPDNEFIYLTITRDLAKHNKFKIVPRHPLNWDKAPLNWDDGFKEIDWDLMSKREYSNYQCKEVCMAESIFKGRIQPQHFYCIFVRTEEIRSEIMAILDENNLSIKVSVNQWFFKK